MKILQVIPYFYPANAYGGPVNVVYEISNELVKRGHEIIVLTTDAYDRNKRIVSNNAIEDINGIKVVHCKNLSNYFGYHYRLFYPYNFKKILKKYLSYVDVVHLHEYRTYQNLITYKYATKYGIPYVVQPHGSVPIMMKNKILQILFNKLCGNQLLKDCNKIIALTDAEKIQLISKGVDKDKIAVIPNGINFKTNINLKNNSMFRKKYRINKDEIILLYVGRINKIKGLDLLIFSFSELVKKYENCRLIIVGDDDGFLKELKKIIAEFDLEKNVIFSGFLENDEKFSAYKESDIFVLPSRYETFPVSLIEALYFNLPSVTTKCVDIPQLSDVATFVDFDKKSLFSGLEYVIEHRGYLKLRLKNKNFGAFNWKNIVSDIESLYYEVLERVNS